MKLSKQKSDAIYIAKAFAIFSVICAHCNSVLEGFSTFSKTSSFILSNLGTGGGNCFLYYFWFPIQSRQKYKRILRGKNKKSCHSLDNKWQCCVFLCLFEKTAD